MPRRRTGRDGGGPTQPIEVPPGLPFGERAAEEDAQRAAPLPAAPPVPAAGGGAGLPPAAPGGPGTSPPGRPVPPVDPFGPGDGRPLTSGNPLGPGPGPNLPAPTPQEVARLMLQVFPEATELHRFTR